MLNTTMHRILFGVALVALIASALLSDAWRAARHDSAQLGATLASQKVAIEQAATREKQRDTQLAAALAAITSQKRSVQTPRQLATAIPAILPPLPLPVSIQIPNLSASPNPDENLPASMSIPLPDLKPLYDSLQDCRASSLESAAAQNDLADENLRAAALIRERDAAIAAAHGGTFWQRVKREAKWFAIGIAAGAAATAAARR
jgi:hypothetical protein